MVDFIALVLIRAFILGLVIWGIIKTIINWRR